MEKLRKKRLFGWTIIQHRSDGGNVVGVIDNNYRNGDGTFGIVWHTYDNSFMSNTVFEPKCWKCEVVPCDDKEDIIFLKRTAANKNPYECDTPSAESNLYTIVCQAAKE